MTSIENNITIVVGSGAVENAWAPVISAIYKSFGIETDQDGANFLMAQEIHLLRVFSIFAGRDHYPDYFEIQKNNLDLLKQNISSELKKAQEEGKIKSRNELKGIIDKFTKEGIDKIVIVTTNWDEVMDIAINKIFQWGRPGSTRPIECYHLHGSINYPQTLYLPSETTIETYRSKKDEDLHGNNHANFIDLLQKSHKTILYGLSLDPLDTELNITLGSSWLSGSNKEIIIINPEHKKVAGRVKLLIKTLPLTKIFGYHPNNLNDKIEY